MSEDQRHDIMKAFYKEVERCFEDPVVMKYSYMDKLILAKEIYQEIFYNYTGPYEAPIKEEYILPHKENALTNSIDMGVYFLNKYAENKIHELFHIDADKFLGLDTIEAHRYITIGESIILQDNKNDKEKKNK